jgi:hypothetical protein
MGQGKFEVKILKEKDGSDANLENLSLEASQALVNILEAMTNIAFAQKKSDSLNVSIRKGSVAIAIEGQNTAMENIGNTLDLVANTKEEDPLIVDYFRTIQNTIKSNGLEYAVYVSNNGNKKDVLDIFKKNKTFTKKREKVIREHNFHVEFFDGRLIEIGGKNPNIHIEQTGIKYTIDCTEKEAKRVESYLYNDVWVTAWAKPNSQGKIKYTFCDHYVNKDLFLDFKKFIKENTKQSGTAPLKGIHNKIVTLIKNKQYGEARKFLKLFNTDIADVSRLRTILLNAKSFKNNPDFKDIIESIVELIEKKTKDKLI